MRLDDSELDELLGPMRDGPVALSGHAAGAARRERLLPGVRAAVRSTPQRLRRTRMLRRVAWGATACGAALVAFVVSTLSGTQAPAAVASAPLHVEALGTEPPTFVDARGVSRSLTGDAPITGPGELLAPASSWSRVLTARGARIELAPRARLRVTVDRSTSPGPSATAVTDAALRLEQGEAHFSVPHLGPHAKFSIATPDTQVIVHGTVFSVRVGPAPVSQTCVRVNEGLVEVRHHGGSTFLRPGMQWGCEDSVAAQASARAVDVSPRVAANDATVARTSPRSVALRPRAHAARDRALAPSGTLEAETALLAAGLAAERDGDRTRARTLFSELLDRHPRSPLAPEARSGAARTR